MTVTLFVPVLNELEGMQDFLSQIPQGLFQQILVVDGQSTDGSAEWARAQGFDVIVQKRRGLRLAYTEGWPHIKSEYVLTYSPDGNCRLEDLPKLVQSMRSTSCDMIIASRYYQGNKSLDDDIVTRFGNWMFTSMTNLFFAGNYTDVMNIFRIYKTKLFYDLEIHLDSSHWEERLFFTRIGIEPLLSIRAAKRKLTVNDIETIEPPRKYGIRKLQIIRWGSAHLVQMIYEKFFWK